MAIEKRKGHAPHHGEAESRTDFEAFLDHMRENPLIYVAAVVFTIVVAVAGVFYFTTSEAARKDMATAYMEALLIETPEERAAELARVAGELRGDFAAEALYMAGEASYRAGDYDQARSFYERVRAEHAGSPFAAAATEGLGYILLDQDDPEAAMERFREIKSNYPTTFEAKRQSYNIARAAEKAGDLDAAFEHFGNQINDFPGSSIAQQAQAALDRLRREHPERFPDALALEPPAAPAITLDGPVTLDEPPVIELTPSLEPPAEAEAEEAEPVEVPAEEPVVEVEAVDPAPTPETDEVESDEAETDDSAEAETTE
jgi:tetratricopeptide (TPR) repeat protein